jgi:large subunit ribosomal protein L16
MEQQQEQAAINYGAFALKLYNQKELLVNKLKLLRVALTRHMKDKGRVWTRVFPNIPVSKKPIEVRMGKGKGNP